MDEKAKVTNILARSFLATALILTALNLPAQEGRKLISKSNARLSRNGEKVPPYGRRKGVVAPDGHIKATKVVGGHPLLVSAVEETPKNWKYAPASTETTVLLEFKFNP